MDTSVLLLVIIIPLLAWSIFFRVYSKRLAKRLQAGEANAVYKQLKWLIPLTLRNPWCFHVRGYIHLQKHELDAALLDANRIIKRNGHNMHYRLLRAEIYLRMGQFSKARKEYEDILFYDPDNIYAHAGFVSGSLLQGELEEALKMANDYIKAQPELPMAYLWHARANLTLNRRQEALIDLNTATELDPTYAEAVTLRVSEYAAGSDEETQAIAELRHVLNEKPGPEIQQALIFAYLRARDGDIALQMANGFVAEYPHHPLSYQTRVIVHIYLQNREYALDDLQRLDAAAVDRINTLKLYGDAYAWTGDVARGLEYFEQAAHEAAIIYRTLLAGQANCLFMLGRKDEAVEKWREILQVDRRYSDPEWVEQAFAIIEPEREVARQMVKLINAAPVTDK